MQKYFKQRFPIYGLVDESWHGVRPAHYYLLDSLNNAKNICCYGLGRLFNDHFESRQIDSSLWRAKVNILSDGRSELWNSKIFGLPVVPPEQLQNIEGLLIITYVLQDEAIRSMLNAMGFKNIINIFDLFKLTGQRYSISEDNDIFFF